MVCTTLDKESPIQAVCPNWARTDLCGGREVTRVPTAKVVGTTAKPTRLTHLRHRLGQNLRSIVCHFSFATRSQSATL